MNSYSQSNSRENGRAPRSSSRPHRRPATLGVPPRRSFLDALRTAPSSFPLFHRLYRPGPPACSAVAPQLTRPRPPAERARHSSRPPAPPAAEGRRPAIRREPATPQLPSAPPPGERRLWQLCSKLAGPALPGALARVAGRPEARDEALPAPPPCAEPPRPSAIDCRRSLLAAHPPLRTAAQLCRPRTHHGLPTAHLRAQQARAHQRAAGASLGCARWWLGAYPTPLRACPPPPSSSLRAAVVPPGDPGRHAQAVDGHAEGAARACGAVGQGEGAWSSEGQQSNRRHASASLPPPPAAHGTPRPRSCKATTSR